MDSADPGLGTPSLHLQNSLGDYVGFDIDLMKELGKRIGVTFKVEAAPLEDRRIKFAKGEFVVDCCLHPAWRKRAEEQAVQIFSDPIYSGLDVFIFIKGAEFPITDGWEELGDKRVAGLRGYHYKGEEAFGERIDASNQIEMLAFLSQGKADVGIMERHVASYYAHLTKKELVFGALQHRAEVSVRLHKSKQHYLNRINRAIADMRAEGVIEKAMRRQASSRPR